MGAAGVRDFDRGVSEDQCGEVEAETAVSLVPFALRLVPLEIHRGNVRFKRIALQEKSIRF
jgi:hypothetical protein